MSSVVAQDKNLTDCNNTDQADTIYVLPTDVSQQLIDELECRYRKVGELGLWQEKLEDLAPLSQVLPTFAEAAQHRESVCVYGRLIKVCDFGKLVFAVLQEGVQTVELKLHPSICLETFEIWKQCVRLGDLIAAYGQSSHSRDGEPQVQVHRLSFLSLCGLPPNSSGISKQALSSERSMQRVHSQMIADPMKVAEFRIRSTILNSIRRYLAEENFEEQITPMLTKSFYGGRSHPFITHSRSEGKDLYLRLTAEIAIKMMVTGGISKIYEIGPSFRNETQDSQHLSGFLLLEAYAAYVPLEKMLKILEGMVKRVISDVQKNWGAFGLPRLHWDGLSEKFNRISARETLIDVLDIDITTSEGLNKLTSLCRKESPQSLADKANLIYPALVKFVYPNLVQPSFVLDLPAGISPFIQGHPQQTGVLQRAFFVWNGVKVAEVFFSELDAINVKDAIERQVEYWQSMSVAARRDYRDFLHAMFCGMPPISVMSIGIERLTMLILGEKDIRRLKIDI